MPWALRPRLILAALLAAALSWTAPAQAREWVTLDYASPLGPQGTVRALLRKPDGPANGQGVLLLHHAGGFEMGTTGPYAELFASKGYTTLELRMFDRSQNILPPAHLYAMMAAGLKFLSQVPGVQPDKVSAVGFSLGAFMTISASSRWFYESHHLGTRRFHRLAAVYPSCWIMREALKGDLQGLRPLTGLPADYLQSFAGVPLLLLSGGKDNYDGSNPAACPDFARAIADPQQAQMTQTKVYPDATHGWDHGMTYEFWVQGGCAVRASCLNRNVFNPAVTAQGKQDLLGFLGAP